MGTKRGHAPLEGQNRTMANLTEHEIETLTTSRDLPTTVSQIVEHHLDRQREQIADAIIAKAMEPSLHPTAGYAYVDAASIARKTMAT